MAKAPRDDRIYQVELPLNRAEILWIIQAMEHAYDALAGEPHPVTSYSALASPGPMDYRALFRKVFTACDHAANVGGLPLVNDWRLPRDERGGEDAQG